jgi:SEFIR domain
LQRPVVFISYSHDSDEHRERVRGLAARLRRDGLDARLDQQVNGTPEQGWPRWMLDQLDEADFVLVVCTSVYYRRFRGHEELGRGKGSDWEGALITQEIYAAKSHTVKFVPVLLSASQESFIPEPLRAQTYYELISDKRYQDLYAFLLGQAGVEFGPIGELKPLLKPIAQPITFGLKSEPPLSPPIQAILIGVPPRNPHFKGRKNLLSRLHKKLQEGEAGPRSPVIIHGEPGVGKSQAVVEYVHQFGAHYRFILWVEAEREEYLRLAYLTIARAVGLIAPSASLESAVHAVKSWLSHESKWLLVFNAVPDFKMIQTYLPPIGLGGKVIEIWSAPITLLSIPTALGFALNGDASLALLLMIMMKEQRALRKIPRIEVGALEQEEAARFIIERIGKADMNTATALAAELDYLPFALEQAAAYIRATGSEIADYIAKYRREGAAIAAVGRSLYSRSIETAWKLSVDAVREASPAAVELLIVASFLLLGTIPVDIFLQDGPMLSSLVPSLRSAATEPPTFWKLIDLLERYSLIERLSDNSFRLRSLTQTLVRGPLGEKERLAWAEKIAKPSE